jgi:hypothetical protein
MDKTHAIIEIDSRDRTSGSIDNFEIILKNPIYLNRNRQYFCRLENIRIPTSFYNIDSNYNTLSVTEDPAGTPSTWSVSVPQGNYTINELLTELNTLLDAASTKTNNFTLSVDDVTGKVTITTDTTEFKLNSSSTLLTPLGFNYGTNYTSSSRSLTSVNHIILSTKRFLKINSGLTSNNHYSKDKIEPIGVVVPITEGRSTIQYFANDNGYKTKMENLHHIKHVDFNVRDANNNVVDFNGVDWNAEMVIYEFRG